MNTSDILKMIPAEVAAAVRVELSKAAAKRAEGEAARERLATVRAKIPELKAEVEQTKRAFERDKAQAANAKIFGGPAPVPDRSALEVATAALERANAIVENAENRGFSSYETEAHRHYTAAKHLIGDALAPHLREALRSIEVLWKVHRLLAKNAFPIEQFQVRAGDKTETFFSPLYQDQYVAERDRIDAFVNAVALKADTTNITEIAA